MIFPTAIFWILFIPFAILIGLAALYQLFLTIAAAGEPGRKDVDGVFKGTKDGSTRFLILIPAHNEEMLIGWVLEQLRKQTYPEDCYKVVVIADNCEDRTATIAREKGAEALERHDLANRGKGQALNWAVENHLRPREDSFDAVVVMDADSVLNPDFLWFMERSLADDHGVVQGYYTTQNPLESWRTSLMTAALAAFHFLRPLARNRMGWSCGLKGNGMGFRRELLLKYGYPAFSVVEDVELALFYLEKGIRVRFVPGAIVYGQMTSSAKEAKTQRVRWEGGRFALIGQWVPRLLRKGLPGLDGARLDGAVDLLLPPFSIQALGAVLLFLSGAGLWLAGEISLAVFLLFAVVPVVALKLYVLSAMVLARVPRPLYLRLGFAPVYVLWKFAAYAAMLGGGKNSAAKTWKRTGRQAVATDPKKKN